MTDEQMNALESAISYFTAGGYWEAEPLKGLLAAGAIECLKGKSCRTGHYDICHAAKQDGVVCPEGECDIDSGVRPIAPPASSVADAAGASEGQAWQPIATAPRDGSNILIRFGRDGVSQAKYVAGTPYPWKFIDTNDGITWLINHAVDTEYGPTHWMPLPPPDTSAENAALRERIAGMEKDAEDLRKFLDVAAGEGYVFDGIDAGDLYMRLFPDAFDAAISKEPKP